MHSEEAIRFRRRFSRAGPMWYQRPALANGPASERALGISSASN